MNEQALKERLKHIAQFEKRTFYQVWRDLTLQRLLVRLSQSIYKDQFIFKVAYYLLIMYTLVVKPEMWIYKPQNSTQIKWQ